MAFLENLYAVSPHQTAQWSATILCPKSCGNMRGFV